MACWQTETETEFAFVAKPNCSMAPSSLFRVFLGVGAVSAAIAGVWALAGAWLVVPFAGLELGALGLAFLLYGWRVGDFERVRLSGGVLRVEIRESGGVVVHEFPALWSRVDVMDVGGRPAVWVSAQGRKVRLGRYLDRDECVALALKLRQRLENPQFQG